MVIHSPLVFVVLGLVLWLVPCPPALTRLNDVGKWTFVIAFSVWLGLFH